MAATSASDTRLIAVADLGPTGVTVVPDTLHCTLAVGLSDGRPFAVSNRCRHLAGPLGKGGIDEDGRLVCPWQAAVFDVRDGSMTSGPGGAFRPVGGAVKATLGSWKPRTYDAELRDGVIHLTG